MMITVIMVLPSVRTYYHHLGTAGINGVCCSCMISSSSFSFRTVDMMMVVMMLRLVPGTAASQGGLLSKLATGFVPAQIIKPGKPPLTPQAVELAQHMLVFGGAWPCGV